MAKVTVLIPTFDHGPTIRYPVRCLQAQTQQDFELFIIGDGVNEPTRQLIHELARGDRRIRFFDFPKHERRGETYRHQVLSEHATGDIVCYLCDRDLWFDDHLEQMQQLLEEADWAHALSLHVAGEGEKLVFFPTDLRQPVFREVIVSGRNRAALSTVGHSMALYRRLPHGWRTTPSQLQTDTYMWQQMLSEDCRAASGFRLTALTFPSPPRRAWSMEQRLAELERWHQRMVAQPQQTRLQLMESAYAAASRELGQAWQKRNAFQRAAEDAGRKLQDIYQSRWWKLRRVLARLPGARRFRLS